MNQNNQVLHICSYYTTSSLYEKMFSKLDEYDIKQIVYVPIQSNSMKNKNRNFTLKNAEYIYSKNFNTIDRLIYFTKINKIVRDSKKKIDIDKIGIIHAHSLFINGGVARRLKIMSGKKYIVEVQNTDINLCFNKLRHLKKVGIRILNDAEQIIFYSPSYKEHLIREIIPKTLQTSIETKSRVIPSGIDEFWLENKYRARRKIDDKKLNLIYVGDVNSNKNIVTTIKACKILIEKGYDISYKIVGRIVDDKLEELINRYNFIKYVPYSPKEELIKHYREGDIFIMPSRYETFGLVYAEALSQGLPVIYTRGQGFDGQFNEGEVGYSVQYDSAEEIVEKIKLIINDYQTISKNCLDKVDKFNWDRIANEYIEVYRNYLDI